MATSGVSICNAALLMVGEDDITSFSDASEAAKLAKSIYTETRQTLLQSYPWRFSMKLADLGAYTSTTPEWRWKYVYALPSDYLHLITVKDEEDYEVYGDKIYTNAKTCEIMYQTDVAEANMPAYFVRALQFELATIFGMALQEDGNKMQLFERQAEKLLKRARQHDAKLQPPRRIPDSNFTLKRGRR